MHLIEYVNLIMLLCLMKQVRLDLRGHMGGNKKIIKCLSVCLYFRSVGDWIFPFHFSFKVVVIFLALIYGGKNGITCKKYFQYFHNLLE